MLVLCQSHSTTNMMTAKNLSLVISPNILRLRVETFAKIAQDTPVTVGAVEYLITQHAIKLGLVPQPSKNVNATPSAELEEKGPPISPVPLVLKPATTVNVTPAEQTPPRVSPWRQYMDKNTGQPYYYNKETKETVWLKPADF